MIATFSGALARHMARVRLGARRLEPGVQALLWMAASGFLYCLLNATLRAMSLRMSPFQALTMVYGATLIVLLPFVLRTGLVHFRPRNLPGIVMRGGVHWIGMCLWMVAVTHITLAETTAIGFTTPLFVMAGAVLLLNEPLRWERAVATLAGFGGVMVVVIPRLQGTGGAFALMMVSASAVFAGSFLLSKRLTRVESPWVIVLWQSLVVTVLSIPLAVMYWQAPVVAACVAALVSAVFTVVGNYCVTRAFTVADISTSQPAKFLDLLWASILGWLIFGDALEQSTVVGGLVILAATIWVARRETLTPRSR